MLDAYTIITVSSQTHITMTYALAGDVNSDGLDDLLIGRPYINEENHGSGYVVYGDDLIFMDGLD